MLAVVAPGQGSQTPGFLAPWLEVAGNRERIVAWSSLIDLDLTRLGTSADADEIRDTSNAQPLLLCGALAGATALLGNQRGSLSYVSGHSVGELAAAALSGVLSDSDAIRLVALRGREMAKAGAGSNTGMSALLGGERDVVIAALKLSLIHI